VAWSPDHSSVADSVKNLYANGNGKKNKLDPSLLSDLISHYHRTTIIIDALDECNDYEVLLLHLQAVSRDSEGAVKFFFSSRTNVDLFDFPLWEKVELDSEKELTAEDIRTYIRTQVKDRVAMGIGRPLLEGKRPDLEDKLVETLTLRARGM
jgi:hypothetical protein